MRTNRSLVNGLEIPTLSEVCEMVKDWAERVLNSEKSDECKACDTERPLILTFSPRGEGVLVSWRTAASASPRRNLHD
jgi:hypothetical protein